MRSTICLRIAAAAFLFGAAGATPALGADATGTAVSPPAPGAATHGAGYVKKKTSAVPSDKQININTADKATLKTLPSLTEAEADKIVAGRPYGSKTDLVTRGVLPEGKYHAIKYRIVAGPGPNANSKK